MNKKQKTSLAGAALLFILALSFSAAAYEEVREVLFKQTLKEEN